MKITNKYNLPQTVVRAVSYDEHRKAGDVSVTELIQPSQITYLKRQHADQIEADAADLLYVLDGKADHYTLSLSAQPDIELSEFTLTTHVDRVEVYGTLDLFDLEGTITDYKRTSVWQFLLDEKVEWEQQINLYATLLRRKQLVGELPSQFLNVPIVKAQVIGLLRDHQLSKVEEEGNYPAHPIMQRELRLWPPAEGESFLEQRVQLWRNISMGLYKDCTPEERWAKPDTWAVKKRGGTRAVTDGIHSSLAAAESFAEGRPYGTEIEYRPGRSTRCERYCMVSRWCSQWAKIQGGEKLE